MKLHKLTEHERDIVMGIITALIVVIGAFGYIYLLAEGLPS